jgi:hypothetical protein
MLKNSVIASLSVLLLMANVLQSNAINSEDSSLTAAPSDPINNSGVSTAESRFQALYNSTNGLITSPLKLKWDQVLEDIFTAFPNSIADGMVFHYGLEDNGKDLCYLIGPGSYDTQSEEVTPTSFKKNQNGQSQDHYVLISTKGNGSMRFPPADSLCHYKNNYNRDMNRKDGGGVPRPISQDSSHPYFVFHEGVELNVFFTEYESALDLYIYVVAGALKPQNQSQEYHMPCFVFGNSAGRFALDEVDYAAQRGPAYRYQNKGLDMGLICPPYCGIQPCP